MSSFQDLLVDFGLLIPAYDEVSLDLSMVWKVITVLDAAMGFIPWVPFQMPSEHSFAKELPLELTIYVVLRKEFVVGRVVSNFRPFEKLKRVCVGLYLAAFEQSGAVDIELAMCGSFVYGLWVTVTCEYYLLVFGVVNGTDLRSFYECEMMGLAVGRSPGLPSLACNLFDGKTLRHCLLTEAYFEGTCMFIKLMDMNISPIYLDGYLDGH